MGSFYEKIKKIIEENGYQIFYLENLYKKYSGDFLHEIRLNEKETKAATIMLNEEALKESDRKDIFEMLIDEKEYFLKQFIKMELGLAQNKMKSTFDINHAYMDVCKNFKDYASLELKKDLEFARFIISINGTYISLFDEKIRNNSALRTLALLNDGTEFVDTFTTASKTFQKDYNNAILFLKKLRENLQLYDEDKYRIMWLLNDIFRVTNGIYENEREKDTLNIKVAPGVQREWLKRKAFLEYLKKEEIEEYEHLQKKQMVLK